MALLGLGYAGFGSGDLDDWRQFGTSVVGQAVELRHCSPSGYNASSAS